MISIGGCSSVQSAPRPVLSLRKAAKNLWTELVNSENGCFSPDGGKLLEAVKDLGRTPAGTLVKRAAIAAGMVALTEGAQLIHPALGAVVGVSTFGLAGLAIGRTYAGSGPAETQRWAVGCWTALGVFEGLYLGLVPVQSLLLESVVFGALLGVGVPVYAWFLHKISEKLPMTNEKRDPVSSDQQESRQHPSLQAIPLEEIRLHPLEPLSVVSTTREK